MFMRNFLFLAILLTVTGGFICHHSKPTSSVEKGTWQLKTIVDGTSTQTLPAATKITATFREGKITGNGGCNGYSSTYSVTGDKVALGPVMSTKMYCPANNWESAYFKVLEGEFSWRLDKGTLTLFRNNAKLVYSQP